MNAPMPMNPVSLCLCIAMLFGASLAGVRAQEPVVADLDIDARRESIVVLERHLAQRKSRTTALAAEIVALDDRVESSVEKIVEIATGIRDSVESQDRVARLKADIAAGLRKTIETYQRQRDSLREQLRSDDTSIPRVTLQSDLDRFNKRIELRVSQIEQIAESLPNPKELEKYAATGTSTWGNWTFTDEKISDAWRQERKEAQRTDTMQDQLIAGLRESVDHLSQRNALMSENLKGNNLSDAERELYQSEWAQNVALIATRQEQIQNVRSSGASPEAIEPINRSAAHETELYVRSMRADLREDFFSIFRKYAELNKERAALDQMDRSLAARKAWLADYDAKNGN